MHPFLLLITTIRENGTLCPHPSHRWDSAMARLKPQRTRIKTVTFITAKPEYAPTLVWVGPFWKNGPSLAKGQTVETAQAEGCV